MIITQNQLEQFAPASVKFMEGLNHTFIRFNLTTPARVAYFMGQAFVESQQFTKVKENLNYSAAGLLKTFPKYFPTGTEATEYAHKQAAIANRVYADRDGNGDESSGDGFLYCGRGLFGTTFRNNYAEASQALFGDDRLLKNPEILEQPLYAALSAGHYWNVNKLSQWADAGDVLSLSRAVNLGSAKSTRTPNGLDERKKATARALSIF